MGAEGEEDTCTFRDYMPFLLNTSDLYISHFFFFYYIVKSWLGWMLQGHRVWGDGSKKWSKKYDFSWISYLFCCSIVQSNILLKDKYFITLLKCLFISLNYFIIFKIKYLKISIH